MTPFRFVLGIISFAFMARYIVAERKLAQARERATIIATHDRVRPWAQFARWREDIIASEHAER